MPHPGCGAKLAASAVTLLARAPLRVATAALQLLDAVYTGESRHLAASIVPLSLPVSLCHYPCLPHCAPIYHCLSLCAPIIAYPTVPLSLPHCATIPLPHISLRKYLSFHHDRASQEEESQTQWTRSLSWKSQVHQN